MANEQVQTIDHTNRAQDDSLEYIKLLSNNASQAYKDYLEDATILHEQINAPRVFNIAVVAKYGAGKSSVIDTYLGKYRNEKKSKNGNINELDMPQNAKANKYARISLASFGDTAYNEIAIERSILQQLLYSRKKSELPNSKIERTNKTSKWQIMSISVLLALFIAAVTLLGVALQGIEIIGFYKEWTVYLAIAVIILGVLFWFALYYHKLKRIKYKDLEAEFNNDKDNSKQNINLINKFVDEVLYFFECVDINLVIFEDLDRLPTTEIFVKLRELNTIINSSNKVANKVTFLYAVKDNLFKTEEERAKFFEFILPVIPVVNPVTTYGILRTKIDKLKALNSKMDLTDKFLKGISVYIPDMRILKNTYNDYILMFHKIFDDEKAGSFLDPNKMFALCLYKNLFPYDYALLEKDSGLIPMVIDLPKLRNKCAYDISNKINEIKDKINDLQSESVNSFAELKAMFIGQLAQLPHGKNQGTTDVMSLTTFAGLNQLTLRHPIPKVINRNYYGTEVNWFTVEFPNGQAELYTPSGESYLDKEIRIKEVTDGKIEKLKQELIVLEKQKQEIEQWSLAQIILNNGLDICFDDSLKDDYMRELNLILPADDLLFLESLSAKLVNKIDAKTVNEITDMYKKYKTANFPVKQIDKQIDYLRFLVAQNYIDEHFLEYTSNYKSDRMSLSDTLLVQKIQQRQMPEFNSKVENLLEFIRWIDDEYFSYPSILIKPILSNINLLYNLYKEDKNDNRYINLITLLSNVNNEIVFDRISEFIATSDDNTCEKFLSFVIPERTTLCEEIIVANRLSDNKKDAVLISTIKFNEQYVSYSGNKVIVNYVNQHDDYLTLFEDVKDYDKVIAFIDTIQPQIEFLDNTKNRIQNHIIKNKFYAINIDNIEIVLGIKCNESECSEFSERNYDMIMTSKNGTLIAYVLENINEYVQSVLLDKDVNCKSEPLSRMEEILRNDNVNIELRKALVKKVNGAFDDIKEFAQELFATMLDYNKVDATWDNILFAYEKIGFADVKSFILRATFISGDFKNTDSISNEVKNTFINDLLKELTSIELKSLGNVISSTILLQDLDVANISDDNLSVAIEIGMIQYNNSDLARMYNEHANALNKYLGKYDSEISNEFDVFFDIALPNITTQSVYVNGAHRNVNKFVAKNNAQQIIDTIVNCSFCDIGIKMKLINKCIEIIDIAQNPRAYANFILLNKQLVPNKILWQFANVSIDTADKLSILIICNCGVDETGNLQPEKIKEYLKSCGEPYTLLFDSGKAKIDKTQQTALLLKVLEQKKIIKEFRKLPTKDVYSVKVS